MGPMLTASSFTQVRAQALYARIHRLGKSAHYVAKCEYGRQMAFSFIWQRMTWHGLCTLVHTVEVALKGRVHRVWASFWIEWPWGSCPRGRACMPIKKKLESGSIILNLRNWNLPRQAPGLNTKNNVDSESLQTKVKFLKFLHLFVGESSLSR